MNAKTSQAAKTQQTGNASSRIKPGDEPQPTQEEDVPLDGRDEVGEKMIEELGRERAGKDQ